MPEIDMRNNPWNTGIPVDPLHVARDIYLLLAFFSASKEINRRRENDDDMASVYGYSIRNFELTEVGRLLVSLSATFRNDWDYRTYSIDEALKDKAESPEVGVLKLDITKRGKIPLKIRESWHKVLHCHTMNFQRSEGKSLYSGHLKPYIHLYGEYKRAEWKATVDVFRWCEVMHKLT
jgi:hypothetical protein